MSSNQYRFEGKRALVCGGSRGLGKAAAIELASLGCEVILLARSEETLKQTLRELPGTGHHYITADLTKVEILQTALSANANLFAKPIEILINNAGGPAAGEILNAELDAFKSAFETHLLCSHSLVQRLLPGMRAANYGRIINIISTSVKQPIPGLGVSNTIRGAMASWSKTLSMEVARYGITVNNILPGATTTDRLTALIKNKAEKRSVSEALIESEMQLEIPMGRFGKPEEIAATIAFLASPQASYITGVSIPVDGGRTSAL
ncbi:SDR family oxidoreductase [bacterium]|nr:SDR family oxidoreductase [bacterium]